MGNSELEIPPDFPLTAVDREILAQTDEEFQLYTWEDVEHVISTNALETLKRKPSDLRRYIAWTTEIKARYGSITNYVIKERLRWQPEKTVDGVQRFACKDPTPFDHQDDYQILKNDWPYAVPPEINHLLVWLKTPIPVEETRGEVTPESRALIDRFV